MTSDSSSPSSKSLNQLATERKRSSTERLVRVVCFSFDRTGCSLGLFFFFVAAFVSLKICFCLCYFSVFKWTNLDKTASQK